MTVSWVGDVYVGAETGLVKSVQLHNQNWINLGGKPSEARRENEILRMCWADGDETQLLMGLRSGDVFRGTYFWTWTMTTLMLNGSGKDQGPL